MAVATRGVSGSLGSSVRRFLSHLEEEKRASAHTVDAYRRDLNQMVESLEREAGPNASVRSVDRHVLRRFLAEVSRGRSARTVTRKLSAVRSFFKYLVITGEVPSNPAELLVGPKLPRKLPAFLGPDAAAEVVEAPTTAQIGRVAERLRDAVALEVLYGCGLRVSELQTTNLDDISLETETIRVRGKGRKERDVPLGRAAADVLVAYLATRNQLRHPKTGQHDVNALLLNRWGRRLSVRWIQKLVARYGALGAGRADLHPHALRHSCATHMLEGGADLRVIQQMLGHASLATTERYTHVSIERLLRVYDDAHPMATRGSDTTDVD